MLCILKANGN